MSNLSEAFESAAARQDEWPAFLVLREVLPPRFRLLAAAQLSSVLEEDGRLSNLLLEAFTKGPQQDLMIDDAKDVPASREALDRRNLVRFWLSGLGADIEYFGYLGLSLREVPGPLASTLQQVGLLRGGSLEQITAVPVQPSQPSLAALIDGYRQLQEALRQRTLVRTPDLPSSSPLLSALWCKHCGDTFFYSDLPSAAREAYEGVLGLAAPNDRLGALALPARLSIAACDAALGRWSEARLSLQALRAQARDVLEAAFLEIAAQQLGWAWERMNFGGGMEGGVFLRWAHSDSWDSLEQARNRLFASGVKKRSREAKSIFTVAWGTALGQGMHPALEDLRAARAFALLATDPPALREAMVEIVRSGDHDAVTSVENLGPSMTGSLAVQVNGDFIDQLCAIARQLPGYLPLRETVLSRCLRAIATWSGLSSATLRVLFARLLDLAKHTSTAPFANADPVRPALEGIQELCARNYRVLGAEEKEALFTFLRRCLAGEEGRTVTELVIDIADEVASTPEDVRLVEPLAEGVVDLLAKRLRPELGQWPEVRASFRFLANETVIDLLRERPTLIAAARRELLRYGFGPNADQSGLQEMSLSLAKRFGITALPEEGRSIIGGNLRRAAQANSTGAPAAVRELLRHVALLSADETTSLVASLRNIVAFRSPSREGPLDSSGAAIAVCELAYYWDEIVARCDAERVTSAARILFDECLAFVRRAAANPSLFTQVSFPPRHTPQISIVTNWSYALLALGVLVGKRGDAEQALALVSAVEPGLSEAVQRSRLDFEAFDKFGSRERAQAISEVEGYDRDQFYGALPSLLVLLVTGRGGEGLGQLLLERALEFGPRVEDIGILSVAATTDEVRRSVTSRQLDAYRQRIGALGDQLDRDAANVLIRLAELFSKAARPSAKGHA